MKAIIENAVEAASQDMSWKAVDRYSQDYIELQTKDNVKVYKTPDAVLKRQLEIFDEVAKKKAADNPLFREIIESQLAFAKRAVQWDLDTSSIARWRSTTTLGSERPRSRSEALNGKAPFGLRRVVLCCSDIAGWRIHDVKAPLHHRRHQHLGRQGGRWLIVDCM
jgi:hypothetical protein